MPFWKRLELIKHLNISHNMEDQIPEEDKKVLQLLANSLMSGNLGIIKTKRRVDGSEATLIVARIPGSDNGNQISLVPIAVIVDGKSINQDYLTPGELEDMIKKEEEKKDIFQYFLEVINRFKGK
jgi:hypothetical protein